MRLAEPATVSNSSRLNPPCIWQNFKKFIADPKLLFGDHEGEEEGEGGEGGCDKSLFDKNPSNDAFVVRTAMIFLDGVRDGLERKRIVCDEIGIVESEGEGEGEGEGGANNNSFVIEAPSKTKVLEELMEICELARDHIVYNTKEKLKIHDRYNSQRRLFEGGSAGSRIDDDTSIVEGEISKSLIVAVDEYAKANGGENIALQLRNCVLKSTFMCLN